MKHRLLVLMIALVLVNGCAKKPPDEESEASPTPTVAVRVEPLTRGDLALVVTATGHIEALHKEKVYSPTAGKITSLAALEGTAFHKGDIMAVIRTKESQAAITGAERMVASATTPQEQSDARQALALAMASQAMLELRSPIDGVISSRNVTEGELVPENSEMFTLVDLTSLVFVSDIPLASLSSVRPGQAAEIRFAAVQNRTVAAVVDAIAPQSDVQSQTVHVRLRMQNVPEGVRSLLKSDMMGTARIVVGAHRDVLLAPHKALLRNDETNTYTLALVNADSIARVIPVSVGIQTDSLAEVSGPGLHEGSLVVTEGNYALPDSTRVTATDDQAR